MQGLTASSVATFDRTEKALEKQEAVSQYAMCSFLTPQAELVGIPGQSDDAGRCGVT